MYRSASSAIGACLLALSTISSAQVSRYDDWQVGAADNGTAVYAATANESGSILAQYCHFGQSNCDYRLLVDSGCEDGSEYPGLMNSDAGAAPVRLICQGGIGDGKYVYVVGPFDAIDGAIRKGTRVGFVLPLKRDEFLAVRFSLRGSLAALTFMRGAYSQAEQSGRGATRRARDSRL